MSAAPAAAESTLAREAATGAPTRAENLAEAVAAHALFWLLVGSGVGLWLATLQLAPEWGATLGAATYGRWAALHLDLTLYGWLALPLVGLLLDAFGADRHVAAGRLALALWSGALAAGAASWLGGRTSGKLFLDWTGPAAVLFAGAQLGVAALLARGLAGSVRRQGWSRSHVARALLLALLLAVPALLVAASDGRVYPPIDPVSGGPTGTSLLGSSLGLVALLLAVPRLLRLTEVAAGRGRWLAPGVWLLHAALFVGLDHVDRPNGDPRELLALGSVVIWAWLLPREAARFLWPPGSRKWLRALAAWGLLLLASGLLSFAPGVLDRVKFGEGLVAHAHVAMAGFASAFVMLVLHRLLDRGDRRATLTAPEPFALWQGGLALQIAALAALGALEAIDPAARLRGGGTLDALLALRWVGGAAMLAATIGWLRQLVRRPA